MKLQAKYRLVFVTVFSLILPSLVFSSEQCKTNEDCRDYFNCIDSACQHKDFFPITFMQVVEIFAVLLFSSVATASGIGGGAIYSTLFMLIENFDASKAFPISNFMILLSSLSVYLIGAQMAFNVPEHKFVDYDLVLVFCPMLLLGTKIGVILNRVLPSVLLSLALVYTLYSSTRKIWSNYNKIKTKEDLEEAEKEKKALLELKDQEIFEKNTDKVKEEKEIEEEILLQNKDLKIENRPTLISKYTSPKALEIIEKLKKLDLLKVDLFEEAQPIRWSKIRVMAELLCILIIDQLIEGSSKVKSVFNIEKCSIFWNLTAILFIVICYVVTIKIINVIKTQRRLNDLFEKTLFKKVGGTEEFSIATCNQSQINSIMFNGFIGGIVAGMLGIGGGMILTPLFLNLGVNPKVTTSTSNFLLVFSAASSSIQYMLAGQLTLDYGLMMALMAMISSIVGYKLINNYVASTGKSSVLIFFLFIVMLVSLFFLPFAAYRKISYELHQGSNIFAFKSFC